MTVFVDELRPWPKTKSWPYGEVAHLSASTVPELLEFARRIGLRPRWMQNDPVAHFDLTRGMYFKALAAGATQITNEAMVERVKLARSRRKRARRG